MGFREQDQKKSSIYPFVTFYLFSLGDSYEMKSLKITIIF